jgi:nicotinate phosphoribosyltransferase
MSQRLRRALGRPEDEVTALRDLHFTGDVWTVPEGRAVLAGEPLLQVTAPLPRVQQLVETSRTTTISTRMVLIATVS